MKADYPEWVMEHKKKGTYVNCVDGKYYLYAAHSERVKGTKKVRRVSDGYIGRITEADGLIPARDKVAGTVEVYEYGLSATIMQLCGNIHSGLRRAFKDNADYVMAASVLAAIYGRYDAECLALSHMSLRFPGVDFGKPATPKQEAAIERGKKMVADVLAKRLGAEHEQARFHLSHLYMVRAGGKLYLSKETDAVRGIREEHGLRWEDETNG